MQMLTPIGEVTTESAADLTFEGIPLEVKTASPSKVNGRGEVGYQFCLYREGKTDYRKASVVILIALDGAGRPKGFFVVPVDRLAQRKKITVKADLSGKWAYWLDKWEEIARFVEGA